MEAGQDSIHEAGKGGRCVAQTKGDLVELEQLSTARSKRGLSFVLLRDRHLPVSTFKVQSREPFSPMESIQEVINPGQRVSILDGSQHKNADYRPSSLPSPLGRPMGCSRDG